MFGLFSSPRYYDTQLGELQRSRGHWRGLISFNDDDHISLVISGNRKAPDTLALQNAQQLSKQFLIWRATIGKALFEHYIPYADAIEAGDLVVTDEAFPIIDSPDQAWSHVTLMFVSILPLNGTMTVELGYRTDWDEEHMLGARFQSHQFLELCGSVLPP